MTDRCRGSSGIGRVVSWQVCWTRRGLRWWVDRWSRHVIWTSCCCVDDKLWSRNSCDGLEAHSRSRGRPIVRSNMNWRRRPERRGMWVEQSSMWYFGQNIILKKIFYFCLFIAPDEDGWTGAELTGVRVVGGIRMCGCGFKYDPGPWPDPPGLEDGWR